MGPIYGFRHLPGTNLCIVELAQRNGDDHSDHFRHHCDRHLSQRRPDLQPDPATDRQLFHRYGATFALFWVALAIICLLLGTFVEIVPVFYLTVPIFAAITLSFNQSLLHLYVVFVAFAGIGMITPPVCVGIYTALASFRKTGQGIPRGATFCRRWHSLWNFDDSDSRSFHLAPVFANQIMIR